MTCPLCSGKGYIKKHPHPQNTCEDIMCPVCGGTGETEEIKVDNKPIVIYKAHGIYSAYAQDTELTAFTALDSEPFIMV